MSDDQPPPIDDNADDFKNDDAMFASAMSPGTIDISLSGGEDDDDEDPFGAPPPPPARTEVTNTVESSSVNVESNIYQSNNTPVNLDENDDPFGSNNSSSPPPPSPVATQVSKTVSQPTTPSDKLNPSFEKSTSSATESKPTPKRSGDGEIEITVSDPTKVGDGMSSYMTYRITTKTTLSLFKKPEFVVNRRFSDFLGLHAKIVNKHLQLGIIIPSPPEKDTVLMAKVKISKDESVPNDFIDRRRALLERYLNRLVQHGKLVEDEVVREFLEMPTDLPKSKDTVALSTAGASRAFTSLLNSVSKLTAKTGEQDQWFEEKHTFVVDLQTHLKHVYSQFNSLLNQRKEAGVVLKQFSTSLNHLATIEEHPSLSSALTELANLEEKLDQVNNEHSYKEYSILTELIKEYVSLLDMVLLALTERIKLHKQWLDAEETLRKKRENKTKLEQSPKGADKIPQAEMEIRDWEGKVEKGKEDFERISDTIKEEMDAFEETRLNDFKKALENYSKNLLEQQEKILQLWEGYLPEANKITV